MNQNAQITVMESCQGRSGKGKGGPRHCDFVDKERKRRGFLVCGRAGSRSVQALLLQSSHTPSGGSRMFHSATRERREQCGDQSA